MIWLLFLRFCSCWLFCCYFVVILSITLALVYVILVVFAIRQCGNQKALLCDVATYTDIDDSSIGRAGLLPATSGLHMNYCSFLAHKDDIFDLMYNIDVLTLFETWLDDILCLMLKFFLWGIISYLFIEIEIVVMVVLLFHFQIMFIIVRNLISLMAILSHYRWNF